MSDFSLTQQEADLLISAEKFAVNQDVIYFPAPGGRVVAELVSKKRGDNFLLDVTRHQINLRKGTNQIRVHQNIVLVRLDFGGAPHRNPDRVEIPCPHIHHYRDGFGDRWAEPLPQNVFNDINDPWQTLHDFMTYCKIVKPPNFHQGLLP